MSVHVEQAMNFPRSSGILLHPTCLPGPYGIGELGPQARKFADFLFAAGQTIWQVLPLGPTGYGDSPYQCFSAFAGNPLLLSLDVLADRGYVDRKELENRPVFPADHVDFNRVIEWKLPLLGKAYEGFAGSGADRQAYDSFCRLEAWWLDDFALFMALKDAHDLTMWTKWPSELRSREPAALKAAIRDLHPEIERHKFIQFEFARQWAELRGYCSDRRIRIMGDVPIYVALDSSDVWAHPELFELMPNGSPRVIAGVPPDYFSATGQLWGNPIYAWEQHAMEGYAWWIARLRRALRMLDLVRLDHFRGFEAYWEVPGSDTTAVNGRWVKGPGASLFEALEAALGQLPIVAENLGVITPEVEALRNRFRFPGMAILQFAFGNDPQAPEFVPHNYLPHLVAYTGTHDNDTVVGWWNSSGKTDSTRSEQDVRREMEFAREYLNTDGSQINWVMIRTLLASVADTVLFPLQDVLGFGSEGRMNLPGTSSGNWRWRFREENLGQDVNIHRPQSSLASDVPMAFVSYSRKDSDFALRLARDLKTANARVWLDQLEIKMGQRWDEEVETALKRSPRILVILSPASVESDNVKDEIALALDQKKAIFPILYRKCDIPLRLLRLQYVDFREPYEDALKHLLAALSLTRAPADAVRLRTLTETYDRVQALTRRH